ncbi:MAG: Ldh family oxidoreductase [Acidobacteria bacterium]|nr:Ldh family oxidoreductase [Acidobacteriota bacterium]
MAKKSVYVPVERLKEFTIAVLLKMGVPREDAAIVADVLLASDLYGVRSHGIAHLKMYYNRIKAGLQLPVTHWVLVHETPATAVIDGGNGMGMVAAYHAMRTAIEKARANGTGAVAVRNSSHYGVAGYYTRMAAEEGMLGMSFSNAHPSVAPTFGYEPLLGTNPIAISAPTDEAFAFTFDAATSVVPRGKIEVAARKGESIPAGWIIRKDGTAATESRGLIKEIDGGVAALLPLGGSGEEMGGHKGYGLATAVEILSAAFQDGAYLSELHDWDKSGKQHPSRVGHFFLAIDIEHFLPLGKFRETAGGILRELRGSGKIPGEERIYTPGEKAYFKQSRVQDAGVEIPPAVCKSLQVLCDELGIPCLDFGA